MVFNRAIVRIPGENYINGITTNQLGKPDLEITLAQHEAYRQALETCGLVVIKLDADLEYPDSTFVEDTAVLTSKCAIITNPGALSRKGEVVSVRLAVEEFYDHIDMIEPPATLDGGDICQADEHFFIGISDRTNILGANQLAEILSRFGFTAEMVDIRGLTGVLHLKSGMSYLGNNQLVLIDALVRHPAFENYHKITVEPIENYAANCVRVNDFVLFPEGYPRLADSLRNRGYSLIQLQVSEFQKMDGGLSCLSLRF